jgi:hypothetical protein
VLNWKRATGVLLIIGGLVPVSAATEEVSSLTEEASSLMDELTLLQIIDNELIGFASIRIGRRDTVHGGFGFAFSAPEAVPDSGVFPGCRELGFTIEQDVYIAYSIPVFGDRLPFACAGMGRAGGQQIDAQYQQYQMPGFHLRGSLVGNTLASKFNMSVGVPKRRSTRERRVRRRNLAVTTRTIKTSAMQSV